MRIFLAAAELFAQQGYRGTSMGEIAKKAFIKPASIYNHYPSKEALLEDLLVHYLKRMEHFYDRLANVPIPSNNLNNLDEILNQLMLSYESHERTLMYWLTRITHHEQFSSSLAANAIIGTGYQKYVGAHVAFFDRLSAAGLLRSSENNHMLGELYARLSLTFATQFLHPEIEPTIRDQKILGSFVNELVICYDQRG